MTHFFEKFKIPTILGLTLIFIGIGIGVFLVLKDQPLISKASPNLLPKDKPIFSNIEDSTGVVSWQTADSTSSFVNFGTQSLDQTAKDDRDLQAPSTHTVHYVTLKNLLPQTSYQLKVVAGKNTSNVFEFKTAAPSTTQNNFGPVIGSVLDGNEQSSTSYKPLEEGIAYLSISNTIIQSSLIKNLGSFLIPLSQIRNTDLSDISPLKEDTVAKLTIVAKDGQGAVAIFKLKTAGTTLPPIRLGQNLDLTAEIEEEPLIPDQDLINFDLNGDGEINATDNAIILRNFGKNPQDKRADLDGNGEVNKDDLDLMAKQINQ